MVSIGIDLGTTYTRVAILEDGNISHIYSDTNMTMTPSCVSFDGEDRYIGEVARDRGTKNPIDTIMNAKRLIGRKFTDPKVQNSMRKSIFKIANVDGRPNIQVHSQGADLVFSPEEMVSAILSNLKEIVEQHVGGRIKDVVITVPSYFNDAQRIATKNAATNAGLKTVRLINETSAAALAYCFERQMNCYQANIVVFHLGGGHLDVSVMKIDEGIIEVLSVSGDTHLGGEDFDDRVLDHLVQEFQKKHNINILADKCAMRRLRSACEKAKRSLSVSSRVSIDLDALLGDVDFNTSLTKDTFEQVNEDLFEKCLQHVDKAMKDSSLSSADIQDVVLVGGSTKIPKIKNLLEDFFGERRICSFIDPDESAVCGAAIQAALINKEQCSSIDDLLLLDIVSRPIFIEGVTKPVVPERTTLPTTQGALLTTYADGQTAFSVKVYEHDGCKNDNLLGSFKLTKIPPFPKGVPEIEMIFELDFDGVLSVSAKDRKTVNHIVVESDPDRVLLPRC